MNLDYTTLVGAAAAACTTASYFPQLKKCWDTGSAGDLSLKMLLILAFGIGTWVVYGLLRTDPVIIVANTVSFLCLAAIIAFKITHDES